MKRAVVCGMVVVAVGLGGCRKETLPDVSTRTLGEAFQAELAERPRPYCVRTGLIGFLNDGASWLLVAASDTYADKVVKQDFIDDLALLRDKGWLRIDERVVPDMGRVWQIYFTPQARERFGITGDLPVQKADVQELCFGPQRLKDFTRPGPIEQVNNVVRTQVTYHVLPTSVPEWATDVTLGDLVWQTPPQTPLAGTARMYLDDARDRWMVDPGMDGVVR